jgi:hypothetical protein
MANTTKNIGKGVKHGENLVQRVRAGILNALDCVERDGKLISEILADEFKNNPIKFMELAIKAMPKEISGEINHVHTAQSLTDDELATIATGSSTGTPEQTKGTKAIH